MNTRLLYFSIALASICLSCAPQTTWAPAGDKIMTEWASEIDPENVWSEYPRPMMERDNWLNLNGLWDYAVIGVEDAPAACFDGQILVPFPIESALSGVGKRITDQQKISYHREFKLPKDWKHSRIMLNFGASDWKTEVFVNGEKIGEHTGGYTPFSFDITDALVKGANELDITVWDPSDSSYQPRGKQVANPEVIWYTSVSGIWQTVWLEPVNETYIADIKISPDVDKASLSVFAEVAMAQSGDMISAQVFDGAELVAEAIVEAGEEVVIGIGEDCKLWSPDSPFLYDLKLSLLRQGKELDSVKSYAAMRKVSVIKDEQGILRLALNNQAVFMYGPLDQGWWPDGLYTAPCDEALAWDIKKTKELGFNMIRKHVKVEPQRWYTHCDREGVLVWQDMPSGDGSTSWRHDKWFDENELVRSEESEANYRKEWSEIIASLNNHPCIVVWVPFNEGWGQFKTKEIAAWTKELDPSRLVNSASGGNHFLEAGDILDLHHYPEPSMYLADAERVNVLGEYGGIGYAVENHLWTPDRNWGYVQFKSVEEVTAEYVKYASMLLELVPKGFSAAVYTQTTDVEIEVNGLFTYDRMVTKVDVEQIRDINQKLCKSLNN